jgi:hypothetical protein
MGHESGRARTRQAAVARFREARLRARAPLMQARQAGVLDAAESVSRLVGDARAALQAQRRDRAAAAAAQRAALLAFRTDLAARMDAAQAALAAGRGETRRRSAEAAAAFRATLRAQTARIVSEDFAGA